MHQISCPCCASETENECVSGYETSNGGFCDEERSNVSLGAKDCGYAYGAMMMGSLVCTSKAKRRYTHHGHCRFVCPVPSGHLYHYDD